MATAEILPKLLRQAAGRPDKLVEFLRAFLEAPIYALVPLSDDHPRLRLVMYRRPDDGVHFIPLFTDEERARASAEGCLRVLLGTGRLWLESSLGAVIVINPNEEHHTLYPEEIADFLKNGQVADLDCEILTGARQVWIRDPVSLPPWLVHDLNTLFATMPFVEAARMFEMGLVEETNGTSNGVLTLAITTTKMYAERAARATIAAIQPACRSASISLDVLSTVSDDPAPLLEGQGVLIYVKKHLEA